MPFVTGDVVYLKSGSPALSVTSIKHPTPGLVTLQWFDGAVLRVDVFDVDCLTRIKPPLLEESTGYIIQLGDKVTQLNT